MAKRTLDTTSEAVPPTTATYTVLARRYRPQQLGELIGQEHIAQALTNALQSGRVAHAYLFTGARGVGKTSTARILAKALNCVNGPTATPCDACAMCERIAAGDDLDVLEIDGASNRGIDEVREIRQNVQYRPSRGRHKIYIIDEVHMLTPQAFNALLKTLEEPPAHVKFIFATTEVQRIPITILSRCQRFDFAGISVQRIADHLKHIVAQEGMQAESEALELIARRGAGSMRDAESLLDQMLAFESGTLTAEQVHRLLGTAREDRVGGLAAAVFAQDGKAALSQLATLADTGLDLGELLDQLIDYWRDLMVVHCAGPAGQALSVGSKQRDVLAQQARTATLDTVLAGLDILVTTKTRLQRGGAHARVLVEMALVRLTRLGELLAIPQLLQQLGNPNAAPAAAPRPAKPAAAVPPTSDESKKKRADLTEPVAKPATLALTAESLAEVWQEVLSRVGPMFANQLKQAGLPAISGPNTLAIRFPVEYNQCRESCQTPERSARLEEVVRAVTASPWSVRFESLTTNPKTLTASPQTAETDTPGTRARRQNEDAAKVALVKKAMDVLGAQIVRRDEGFGTVQPETNTTGNGES